MNHVIIYSLLAFLFSGSKTVSSENSCFEYIDGQVKIKCNNNFPCSQSEKNDHKLHVKKLSTESCKFNVVYDSINEFTNLTDLDLSYADVNDTSFRKLGKFKHAEKLTLAHNNLTNVPVELSKKVPALTEINLSHNEIAWVDTNVFFNLKELNVIDLSNNKIKTLPKDWPPLLKRLDITNNDIDHYDCSALRTIVTINLSISWRLESLNICDCVTNINYRKYLWSFCRINHLCFTYMEYLLCDRNHYNNEHRSINNANEFNQNSGKNDESKTVSPQSCEEPTLFGLTLDHLLIVLAIVILILFTLFAFIVIDFVAEKREREKRRQNRMKRAAANENLMVRQKPVENPYILA